MPRGSRQLEAECATRAPSEPPASPRSFRHPPCRHHPSSRGTARHIRHRWPRSSQPAYHSHHPHRQPAPQSSRNEPFTCPMHDLHVDSAVPAQSSLISLSCAIVNVDVWMCGCVDAWMCGCKCVIEREKEGECACDHQYHIIFLPLFLSSSHQFFLTLSHPFSLTHRQTLTHASSSSSPPLLCLCMLRSLETCLVWCVARCHADSAPSPREQIGGRDALGGEGHLDHDAGIQLL